MPRPHCALDKTYPAYKINLFDIDIIVRGPFFAKSEIADNGTRGFIGYCLQLGRLVFIKDFWEKEEREADTGTMEVVTYGHLLNHNVSHIPDLILAEVVLTDTPPETAAGDSASSLTDRFQRTQAHNFYRHFKSRRHTRVVQEILFPVTEAENSRQLVEVVRDAIQGMWSLPAWLLADGADTMNRSSVVRGS